MSKLSTKASHSTNKTYHMNSSNFNTVNTATINQKKLGTHKRKRKFNASKTFIKKKRLVKMITNLFSIFDPSSRTFSLLWVTLLVPIVFVINNNWKKSATPHIIQKAVIDKFKKEISYSLGKPSKGTERILILIFVTILLINLVALYPQNFSTTAHLPITLPLSLTIWLSIIIFGWAKNTKHMLSHLLPQGTPIPLINFIVLIEITRNLIRPITLCVRLTANFIAGHLLISLLGNALITIEASHIIISMLAPLILTILEGAVACIQAYVFITLITLYTTEIR